MSISMLVYSITISFYASYVAWNLWGGSCGAWFLLLAASSLSTFVISISTIGQPMRFVEMNESGSFKYSSLTQDITVSGIGIVYQLLLVIFFADLRLINQNPPCSFPLVPRKMAPLVHITCLCLGSSCSCTWQQCPILGPICCLYFSVSMDIMFLVLRTKETPT